MAARPTITALISLAGSFSFRVIAADLAASELESRFTETVRPFVETYCVTCHSGEKPKSEFDLSLYSTMAAVVRDHLHWELVLERLEAAEMPPEKAKLHPTPELRQSVVDWIHAVRRHEAEKNAGDPGIVFARRLSNAEYDYTIRDLTGVDIRPTREFPVDPANQAGFDNSGESLAMSPALVKKYLQAARQVAEHLVLQPDGLAFAPHPMMADTDCDKYCVLRIVDFYQRQPTDYADYFMAAWRFKNRAALGKPKATLADFAAETKVSSKYLALIWSTLTETRDEVGPVAKLQAQWRKLPAPKSGKQPDAVRSGCEQMRDFVVQLREKIVPEVKNLTAPGIQNGSQTLVMWKNRQMAANRRRYDPGALHAEGTATTEEPAIANRPVVPTATNQSRASQVTTNQRPPSTPEVVQRGGKFLAPALTATDSSATFKMAAARKGGTDAELVVPATPAGRARYEAAFARFCSIFPDAFYISERARVYLDPEKEKNNAGRLLSAGLHSMTGYFRDDGPLYDLILDEQGQRELNRLWQEFDFIASVPQRMHTSFIWFERTDSKFMIDAEFDFARAEDKDSTSEAKIRQLADVYLAKARRNSAGDSALAAIQEHFERVSTNIRRVELERVTAQASHLAALQTFAERAYRRPLSQPEREALLAFYHSLREQDGLAHDEAIRDSVVSVLMSPHFCYRIDLVEAGAERDRSPVAARSSAIDGSTKTRAASQKQPLPAGASPLSDYALASRLSYFLWSSMPDEELLARSAAGDLHRPEVIAAQARRMLKDGRVRNLAAEFGGNWLDFRRFEEHNAVDRERFPGFNNELRQAMFEEPIRFFVDVVHENRPVLDFLYAKHTFVNPVLAKHYGLPDLNIGPNEWVRFDDARRYERGGLLPMSVFLTRNAPGLRTSPVKRGYWVVRRLLGERIPPPPAQVPELPHDEAKLGDLTLREVLAKHREDKSCAACHERFDSFGLVYEGYGPVGEVRTKDLGGRPVDTHAAFPGGSEGTGIEGLRTYLREHRQADFLDNLCRKLLAYALGRTLMLSDESTIRGMRAKLAANDYRFDNLVESIVTSPQFLTKRDPDHLATN